MATKRKYDLDAEEVDQVNSKKHTLDSDEEDSDEYEKDEVSDVEGEEDGVSNIRDDVKITPFNMREELEEGHFDKEGHYHWNKESEIRDNWLDNIDWVKVDEKSAKGKDEDEDKADDINTQKAQVHIAYQELLNFMEKRETVSQTLCRLGKNRKKLSTAERLKNKKLGIVDEVAEKINKFTELANNILTSTGNMDVYEMTYQQIEGFVQSAPGTSKSSGAAAGLDMYSDDFCTKEQEVGLKPKVEFAVPEAVKEKVEICKELLWEFKWSQKDTELQGPYKTKKMLEMSRNGEFKDGVYVRKVGEDTNFYTSNRIDFDLYL